MLLYIDQYFPSTMTLIIHTIGMAHYETILSETKYSLVKTAVKGLNEIKCSSLYQQFYIKQCTTSLPLKSKQSSNH